MAISKERICEKFTVTRNVSLGVGLRDIPSASTDDKAKFD
jgi:hypothetical protein